MTMNECMQALKISHTTLRKYFILLKMGDQKDVAKKQFSKDDLYKIAKTIDTIHSSNEKEKTLDSFFEQKNIEAKKTKEEKLSLLKKEHPLVMDERFFELTYFPPIDDYEFLIGCNTVRVRKNK